MAAAFLIVIVSSLNKINYGLDRLKDRAQIRPGFGLSSIGTFN